MNKFKKTLHPIPEYWGRWEDRSRLLKYHPSQHGDEIIVAAYTNQVLSVQWSQPQCGWGILDHLWVRRHDEKPLTWRELQRVKNELVGKERVAVEVYPPVSQVVDCANIYHLWVFEEGFELPFGLHRVEEKEGV